MKVKVQFDCEERYVTEIDKELSTKSLGVLMSPVWTYNNYSALYIGNDTTPDEFYTIMRKYVEESKVTYFEIGHF